MKINYPIFFTLFFSITQMFSQSNIVNIPDVNFKNYLLENSSINANNDNEIQVAEAEAFSGKIDVKGSGKLESLRVKDLTGIEAFTSLTALDCEFNGLTNINVSQNIKLLDLHCSNNQISSLDVSKNTNLEELECFNNKITTLDISQNLELVKLWCNNNLLSNLDVTKNVRLRLLEIEENQFTNLDVSKNIELTTLVISKNNFTNIDISNNRNLLTFYARANDLESIDFSTNFRLDDIVLIGNNLTFLDMSKRSNTTRLLAYANANLSCIKIEGNNFVPPTCVSNRRNGWCVDEETNYSEKCETASVNKESFSEQIIIYPNPLEDILQISLKTNATIKSVKIFNLLGKQLIETQQRNIDISMLLKGMYIVKIENSLSEIAVRKIVK
ncbi:T9SS type A sorting domain-containing protein [uncultured Polaribacter sp.]|uniref:T9SS type A sorting domain-containing protein n=1 Tax=uncultured Polaribacter sp. TaxID=174711 RepID=UPI002625BFB0|nr:T9SS type A sorting domain-containing protein [uncultured Polaribacter sp.]